MDIPNECRKKFIKSPVSLPLLDIIHLCEKKFDTINFSINGSCVKKIKNNIPNATKTYRGVNYINLNRLLIMLGMN